MNAEHPNISIMRRLDVADLVGSSDLFDDHVVFHYYNPLWPDIQGDYVGISGVQTFFAKVAALSDGAFKIEPISITPVGSELVVTHTKNTVPSEGQMIVIDVVVVWRLVNGKITEVWDIPSVFTPAGLEVTS